MIRSTILSLIITATAGIVAQRIDDRPALLVFCGPGPNGGPCEPCERFKSDYRGEPQLRPSLETSFRDVRLFDVRTSPDVARRYRVDRWPTFIVLDSQGRTIRRIVGYQTGRELWTATTGKTIAGVSHEKTIPPAAHDAGSGVGRSRAGGDTTLDPAAGDGTQKTPEQRVDCSDGICRLIESDLKAMEGTIGQLRTEAGRARAETAECASQIQRLQAELDEAQRMATELQSQLKATTTSSDAEKSRHQTAIEALEQRIAELSNRTNIQANSVRDLLSMATDAGSGGLVPQQSTVVRPSGNVLSRVFRQLVAVGLEVGLTSAQSEVVVGLGSAAGPVGLGLLALRAILRRKKKADDIDDGSRSFTPDDEATVETVDEFELPTLPFQDVDYTTTWADHWIKEGKSPELMAKEYSHFVNAFAAVSNGELKLPGIEDGPTFAKQVRNWVARQFRAYVAKQVDNNNPNHRAFYAFLHKQAFENIRNGKFNEAAPNPRAADVLEDWVNERIVGSLVFNPNQ